MKVFERSRSILPAAAFFLATWAATACAQPGDFPLREGDVVVMAGDSITAQHKHTNYIEGYCVTRFPKWNLQFRNAGVPGDTVPLVLARLDTDVLFWKPTVVTIELGMNDSERGPGSVAPYLEQLGTLIGRVRAAGARPVLLTASPVDDGTTFNALRGHDAVLDRMATAVDALAAREKLPCADQFHALLNVWAKNFTSPDKISLSDDGIHPHSCGQLTMAYACLIGLGAPGLVSTAAIGPRHDQAAGTKCAIQNLKWTDGDVISFERTDECLPMPIPDDGREGLKLVPLSAKLNRYILIVKTEHTPPAKWDISIDGTKVATVSNETLEEGWNMSELTEGPIAAQCRKVLELIQSKRASETACREVARWRAPAWLNDPALDLAGRQKAELDRLIRRVAAVSEDINAAAQPKPHKFLIEPAK